MVAEAGKDPPMARRRHTPEQINRDLRERLRRNVEANTELSEAEAMDLAVSEAQAVRRRRRRGPAPR